MCRGYRERVKCNIHTWLIFSYPACTLPDLTDCTLMPPHTFCTNKTHMQTHRYTKNPLHLNIKNDTRTKTEMFTEIWQYTMTIQWKKNSFLLFDDKVIIIYSFLEVSYNSMIFKSWSYLAIHSYSVFIWQDVNACKFLHLSIRLITIFST